MSKGYNVGDRLVAKKSGFDLSGGQTYIVMSSDCANEVAKLAERSGKLIPGTFTWGCLDSSTRKAR